MNKEITNIWLTECQNLIAQNGIAAAKDALDLPITLVWEKIAGKSPRLSEKVKDVHEILSEIYAEGEIKFARQFPETVPAEYFLKSLTPLFKDGIEKVDWELAKKHMKATFQHFFNVTDFTQFAGNDDIYIFVVAKDKITNKPLGLVQFIVTPEYAYGEIKVAYYGVLPEEQDRGIEKLLMSAIFKIMPQVNRIFMHTRCTNTSAINLYCSWGFTLFPGPLAHWTDLEYLAKQSDTLQKTVQTINNLS